MLGGADLTPVPSPAVSDDSRRARALQLLREIGEPGLGAKLDAELAKEGEPILEDLRARQTALQASMDELAARIAEWGKADRSERDALAATVGAERLGALDRGRELRRERVDRLALLGELGL